MTYDQNTNTSSQTRDEAIQGAEDLMKSAVRLVLSVCHDDPRIKKDFLRAIEEMFQEKDSTFMKSGISLKNRDYSQADFERVVLGIGRIIVYLAGVDKTRLQKLTDNRRDTMGD